MANRVKEDEKHERIIRGLLKLPENRRCINCNSLGPQYVCTNFWTFVCTTCGGIHREFTHRVKSVSMAKFTSQEVTALQEGGNQRARDIYFKEWDPQRQSAPDSSNVERLRDFIKHVFVDRRYTGERNLGKPPSVKGDKEDLYENRRTDSYQGESRSPPYSERSSPGGRSPGYEQESRQYNNRTSPARSEIINDWRREDRFGNGRKVEDRRISDGDSKRSPERPKEKDGFNPPIVRPVREILGDNIVPLRIAEPPKANAARSADGFAQTQRTVSSSSLGSTSGNPVEVKVENTMSLIDFDADPEPPVAAAVAQSQPAAAPQQPTSDNNNWASFDFSPEIKASQAPQNTNSLDSVLSQLSVPPSGSGGASFPAPLSAADVTAIHHPGVSAAAPGVSPGMFVNGGDSFGKVAEVGQWPNMQHQQPSLFSVSSGPTPQQFTTQIHGASGNQPWHANVQSVRAPQVLSQPTVPSSTTTTASEPSAVEVNLSGRRELPADLFAATYSPYPGQMGWQTGPHHGMGFAMRYNNVAVPMQSFPQPSKSANPFDLSEPVQPQSFPSMVLLQASLPNMPPSSGLQQTSSLGTPSHAWMPAQSPPYPSGLPSQAPAYASAVAQGPFVSQQVPGSLPPSGHQVVGNYGSERPVFGGINMDQQMPGRFSAPPTPQPYSSVGGGNPFG